MKTLYVVQSDPAAAVWMAFDVKPDGTVVRARVFFDATAWAKAGRKGLPDGMDVDQAGNLFATGPWRRARFAAHASYSETLTR